MRNAEALRECAKQSDLNQLVRDVAQLKQTAIQMQITEFVYDRLKPLAGIIAHLTRECGGNVHDKGIMNVTSSSVSPYPVNRQLWAKNVVDFGTDSYFASHGEPNSWILYDFKRNRVIPKSYSMKPSECGRLIPKSWVIEVSNDGSSWTEIDRRDNNSDWPVIPGCYISPLNFKISRVQSQGFRFFRLRQTGKNHRGNDLLALQSLEVFGTPFEK